MLLKKVYACSGIFIAHLKGNEPYSKECEDILLAAEEGSIELHTGYITVVEVVRNQRGGLRSFTSTDERAVADLMDKKHILKSALEIVVAERSRWITWDTQAQPADAVHLATAMVRKCQTFYTTDIKLLRHSQFQNGRISLPEIKLPEFIRIPELPLT